ncbi:MAG TPA: hypothetical protein VK504_25320 [Vicinamibacterales bacterium]|nr:hypothetical protein [Vicinamibacterales bacterium]
MNSSNVSERKLQEHLLLLDREHLRRRASTNLHEFVAQAWHVVEPATEFVDNWHVGAICEHLEAVSRGEIRRLLINIPPRFLKSTICSVMWPAHTWIHKPAHKWLCGSYALKLAIRDNLKMRRLIQSPWYQERWGRGFNLVDNADWGDPNGFVMTGDQNQKMRFENDRSGYRIAFSFEGGVMGEGGDTVLIDDPHDREGANSDAEREHSIGTYREGITTRLNDPARSPIVIIMQRLHEHDLSGHVIAEGGYEHLLMPMHFDPKRSTVTCIGWSDPRKTAGELLHPERFTPVVVDEWERNLGSYAAAGQLEQAPAPAEGGILKKHWWRFYNDDEFPEQFDAQGQSWDMAFKGKQTSNFVAGQHWGRKGANCYMSPDEVYAQLDMPGTVTAVRAFTVRHPKGAKWVEDKANGPAVMDTLKGEIPGFIPVNDGGGAEAMVRSIAVYAEAGNVWLANPYNARADKDGRVPPGSSERTDRKWVLRFIQNAATFPNGSIPAGSHGDDVVAGAQAIHKLMHRKRSIVL